MPNNIQQIEPPVIGRAPQAYTPGAHDTMVNTLRLFFNRITAWLGIAAGVDSGARIFYFPYASFYDTTTQTVAVVNTAYPITFNTMRMASADVSLVSSSRITCQYGGVYRVQALASVGTASASGNNVEIWVNVSGTEVDYTAVRTRVRAGFNYGGVDTSVLVEPGGYIELWWRAANLDFRLERVAPIAAGVGKRPGVPSITVTVGYMSNG